VDAFWGWIMKYVLLTLIVCFAICLPALAADSLQDQLCAAVKNDDVARFQQLLRRGAKLIDKDSSGHWCFHYSDDPKWLRLEVEFFKQYMAEFRDPEVEALAQPASKQPEPEPVPINLYIVKKDAFATRTQDLYSELVRLVVAKDAEAVLQMFAAGDAIKIIKGTPVFVEEGRGFLTAACRARLKGLRQTWWLSDDLLDDASKLPKD
jgi:hypothetical protein